MNDQEISDLLSQYRRARGPSAAERERAWRGVQAHLAAGAPALVTTDAAARSAATSGGASAGTWTTLKVLGALTLVGAPAAWWATSDANPGAKGGEAQPAMPQVESAPPVELATRPPAQPSPPPAPSEAVPAVPSERASNSPASIEPDPSRVPRRRPRADTRRPAKKRPAVRGPEAKTVSHEAAPSQPTAQSTLGEELVLIQRAQGQVNQGDPEQALTTLDAHARQFPQGRMAPSREVTRMLALCALGQETRARTLAARFLRETPTSPFAGRVRAMCPK